MYKLLLAAGIGILLTGCRDTYELEGKVFEQNTTVTIPHRKIIVHALANNNQKSIPVYVDEFFTDSAGCFQYSLGKIKNVYLYDFSVVGDSSYAFSSNVIGHMDLLKNGRFLSFYTKRLADFTIEIERENTNYKDTLYVSWVSEGINGKVLYPYTIKNSGIGDDRKSSDLEFRWIGGSVNSTIKTKVYAEKQTIVQWELYRKGDRRKITDTIFCFRDVPNYVYFKY